MDRHATLASSNKQQQQQQKPAQKIRSIPFCINDQFLIMFVHRWHQRFACTLISVCTMYVLMAFLCQHFLCFLFFGGENFQINYVPFCRRQWLGDFCSRFVFALHLISFNCIDVDGRLPGGKIEINKICNFGRSFVCFGFSAFKHECHVMEGTGPMPVGRCCSFRDFCVHGERRRQTMADHLWLFGQVYFGEARRMTIEHERHNWVWFDLEFLRFTVHLKILAKRLDSETNWTKWDQPFRTSLDFAEVSARKWWMNANAFNANRWLDDIHVHCSRWWRPILKFNTCQHLRANLCSSTKKPPTIRRFN